MKLYRFSPIESHEELLRAIHHLHREAHQQCYTSLGRYLPVPGNIGIFCHYQDEYEFLTRLREELTDTANNWNQKYFKLHEPIVIPQEEATPAARYEYLYIRKPDPYRHHVGDIDFYLPKAEYSELKQSVATGQCPDARIFPEARLDMIELYNPDSDVLSYISDKQVREEIRHTKTSHSPS